MTLDADRSVWYRDNFKAPRKRKKDGKHRRGWIAVLIIICIPALIALCAVAATLGARLVLFSGDNGSEYSITIPGTIDDYTPPPVDPREFFRRYYISEESYPPSVIDRAEPLGDFTMTLHSAEGCDQLTLQELYPRCIGSIVSIEAFTDNLGSFAWGTGIVLSEDGYIITNQHIVSGAKRAVVTLQDGAECPALLVGEDTQTDLAVLKIEAEGLTPAQFGDSGELTVGDDVAAIGNPLSSELIGTMTTGIISAINRDISMNGRRMVLLQTSAAINNGSSGGALINMYGQVIGVTNMKMSSAYSTATVEGICFAIPSATVKTIADQLIANGEVTGRPGLGVTLGSIPETARQQYGYPEGLYVSKVSDGSDAKKQGIREGDIITAVEGTPVTTTDEVLAIRDDHAVGDTLTFSVWREGKTVEIPVKIVDQNDIS